MSIMVVTLFWREYSMTHFCHVNYHFKFRQKREKWSFSVVLFSKPKMNQGWICNLNDCLICG